MQHTGTVYFFEFFTAIASRVRTPPSPRTHTHYGCACIGSSNRRNRLIVLPISWEKIHVTLVPDVRVILIRTGSGRPLRARQVFTRLF